MESGSAIENKDGKVKKKSKIYDENDPWHTKMAMVNGYVWAWLFDLDGIRTGRTKSNSVTEPAPPINSDNSQPILDNGDANTVQDEAESVDPCKSSFVFGVDDQGYVTDDGIEHDKIERIQHGKRTSTDYIVMHRTAGSSTASAINWWKDSENNPNTSATTFIIDKDGTLTQTSPLETKTYHTRNGTVDGEAITNSNSIGIELVGLYNEDNEAFDPLTDAQKATLIKLTNSLKEYYNLDDDSIFYHYEIDPKNKLKPEGKQAVETVNE